MFCFGPVKPVQIIFLGNKSEKKKFSNTLDDLRHNEMEATISYLDGQKSVEKEKDELETKRLKLSINFSCFSSTFSKKLTLVLFIKHLTHLRGFLIRCIVRLVIV